MQTVPFSAGLMPGHAQAWKASGVFPFADLDNCTACLNGYPALSAHPARRAGENAAERSRGWNGFRMETGRYTEDEICLVNHGIWIEKGKEGSAGGFYDVCGPSWKMKREISAGVPVCGQRKTQR